MLKEDVNAEILIFEEGDKSIVPEVENYNYFRKKHILKTLSKSRFKLGLECPNKVYFQQSRHFL